MHGGTLFYYDDLWAPMHISHACRGLHVLPATVKLGFGHTLGGFRLARTVGPASVLTIFLVRFKMRLSLNISSPCDDSRMWEKTQDACLFHAA